MRNKILIAISGLLVLVIILVGVFYAIVTSGSRELRKTAIGPELIPPGIEGSVAFVNVNVIPMDSERVSEGWTVVTKDGRIADLGPSSTIEVPAEAIVVDGEGKFLMPGLSDMHVHLFGSENDLLLYLANGVTTIKEVGGGPPVQLEWRDQINSGVKTGPNIVQFSPLFDTMGTLDAIIADLELPGGKVNASNPEDMEGLVAGYSVRNPKNAHIIAWTLLKREDAKTKLAAIMNKLSVRIAEAEDVPLLVEGKQEEASG